MGNYYYGQGYRPVEKAKTLADGQYTAKILKIEPTATKDGSGQYLKVTVAVKDNPGALPNQSYLYDRPSTSIGTMTLEQSQEMWDRNMTQFFDSFQIQRGNFDFGTWVNKVGTITIRPQRNKPQYKEIVLYPVEAKKEKEQEETPVPAPQVQSNEQEAIF